MQSSALLPMVMLVGPLIGINDPGKVRNRRVAKSRIVLLIFLAKRLFHDSSFMDVDTAL